MAQTMGNQLLFASLLIGTTLVVVRATFAQSEFSLENCFENFKMQRDIDHNPDLVDPSRFCPPSPRHRISFDTNVPEKDPNQEIFRNILNKMDQDCKKAIELTMIVLRSRRERLHFESMTFFYNNNDLKKKRAEEEEELKKEMEKKERNETKEEKRKRKRKMMSLSKDKRKEEEERQKEEARKMMRAKQEKKTELYLNSDHPYCIWMSFKQPKKLIQEIQRLSNDKNWSLKLVERLFRAPDDQACVDDFERVENPFKSTRVDVELLNFPTRVYAVIYGERDYNKQMESDYKEMAETIKHGLSQKRDLGQTKFAKHFEDVRNIAEAAVETMLRMDRRRSHERIEQLVKSDLVEGCKAYLAAYKHVFEDKEHLRNLDSDYFVLEKLYEIKGPIKSGLIEFRKGARTYLYCFLLTNTVPADKLIRAVQDRLNQH